MMTLQKYAAILPLVFAGSAALANEPAQQTGSVFHFSTQVSRTVEKDLMQVEVYSRQSGKQLSELKKSVSADLNKVLAHAKQSPDIEVVAHGITNQVEYNDKGKVVGWTAEGSIQLTSKQFETIANVLDQLGDNVAIRTIAFSVSPEKMASLEDEMTLDIIKQFQHKADVIQKGLNAKHYVLSDIQLDTPNSANPSYPSVRAMYAMEAGAMKMKSDNLPMEAGKEIISTTASGKVTFE